MNQQTQTAHEVKIKKLPGSRVEIKAIVSAADFDKTRSEAVPPVWPDPEGAAKGMAFSPLYKNASRAARKDAKFHELLALVDALRGGRARERELAIGELDERLGTG